MSIWVPLFIKAFQKAGDTPHFQVVVLRDRRPANNPPQENIEQDEEYRRAVLPKGVPVLAIEASKSDLWYKYFSGKGAVIGVDTFGESAPACVLWERFGFTVENVVAKVEQLLK